MLAEDALRIQVRGALRQSIRLGQITAWVLTQGELAFILPPPHATLRLVTPQADEVAAVFVALVEALVHGEGHKHDPPRCLPHHWAVPPALRLTAAQEATRQLRLRLEGPPLQRLELAWSRVDEGSLEALGPLVSRHASSLRHVDTTGLAVSARVLEGLLDQLSACPRLLSLRLSYTALSGPGLRRLAQLLPSWPELQELHLASLRLTPEDVAGWLAEWRLNQHPLPHLHMSLPSLDEGVLSWWTHRLQPQIGA